MVESKGGFVFVGCRYLWNPPGFFGIVVNSALDGPNENST